LPTCCELVGNSVYYQVRNKLATSRYNGIWETTRHKTQRSVELTSAHANLLRTYYRFAMGKLRGNWCNGFWPSMGRGILLFSTTEDRSLWNSKLRNPYGGPTMPYWH